MSNWKDENTDRLVKGLLSLKTEEECYSFLEDVCTIPEIIDISKRLTVARLLSQKMSYSDIIAKTGVSAATISRISRCFEYGCGGYKTVLDRLEGDKK